MVKKGRLGSGQGHVGGEGHLVFPEASKVYFQVSFHVRLWM